MSWNIYFDDETGDIRYPAILDFIQAQGADIVCLQEVTDKFLKYLRKSPGLSDYKVFHSESPHRYRNIILSRLEVANSSVIELPTRLGRNAPYISVDDIKIFSLHLESMPEDIQYRLDQLTKIMDSTVGEKVILCGDMNFGDEDPEDIFVQQRFKDVGKSSGGFTYDIDRNKIAARTKFDNEVSRRLDRFLLREEMKIESYRILKDLSSDHFPILLELRDN